jgi:hypothetical protein
MFDHDYLLQLVANHIEENPDLDIKPRVLCNGMTKRLWKLQRMYRHLRTPMVGF